MTATIPLGALVTNPGIAIAPGASQAVVLATTDREEPLSVAVDLDRAVVESVTALDGALDPDVQRLRPLGVGPAGDAIVLGRGERAHGGSGRTGVAVGVRRR